jgi:hypothetical protein
MKLYKAKATITVYFMSEKDVPHRLAIEAEDLIRDSIRHNGMEPPTVTEVRGQEPIEGDWDPSDFVYGSEDLPGDEPMGLKAAMEWAAKRALPAEKQ